MSKKVEIFVACHKPAEVYHDEVYKPIHVGRAISKCTREMSDMIGDDTGDNISAKNPSYCELTAQYWAWKNSQAEYVGLCHYRRYFQTLITDDNVDRILGNHYDALCVTRMHEKLSLSIRLVRASCLEDFHLFMYSLKKISPESYPIAKRVMVRGVVTPFNMFVMKKTLFDEFAAWQFAILGEMEKHVRLSGYTRARRVFGYYAEMLLPIFLEWKRCKVKYDDFVSFPGEKPVKPKLRCLRNLYSDCLNKLMRWKLDVDGEALMVGFKIDGIEVGYVEKNI